MKRRRSNNRECSRTAPNTSSRSSCFWLVEQFRHVSSWIGKKVCICFDSKENNQFIWFFLVFLIFWKNYLKQKTKKAGRWFLTFVRLSLAVPRRLGLLSHHFIRVLCCFCMTCSLLCLLVLIGAAFCACWWFLCLLAVSLALALPVYVRCAALIF